MPASRPARMLLALAKRVGLVVLAVNLAIPVVVTLLPIPRSADDARRATPERKLTQAKAAAQYRGRGPLSLVVLIVAIALGVMWQDYLPPRTCLKQARLSSHLNIPRDAKVASCKSASGLGDSYDVVIDLDSVSFASISSEAAHKGYMRLSELTDSKFPRLIPYYGGRGWYMAELTPPYEIRIIVLDAVRSQIVLYTHSGG